MQSTRQGTLIAIEGIDGSGKSTLAKNLYQILSKKYQVLLTKEPGATKLGYCIRQLVQTPNLTMCPLAEYMLFAADRAQHFYEIVFPELKKNKIVISDRMSDSSLIYQGYGRKLDIKKIDFVNKWTMDNRSPDITIYVRVSADIATQRILLRNLTLTKFETEKKDFFVRLIEGFDKLYKNRTNVIIVNGNQTQEQITQEVATKILSWIKKHTL